MRTMSNPVRWTAAALSAVLLAVGGATAGLLAAGGTARASATAPGAPATVEVTGQGEATGTPDTATLDLAVVTNAPSASAALDENDAAMSALQAVFAGAGVPAALQSTGLSLAPSVGPNGVPDGFAAEHDLAVVLHDVARAGQVIDAAVHAAGNDVQLRDISFSVSDALALRRRARVQAMEDAEAKAAQLAAGAGRSLGPIRRIVDEPVAPSPPVYAFGPNAAAQGLPLQPGTDVVTVRVDVVYALGS